MNTEILGYHDSRTSGKKRVQILEAALSLFLEESIDSTTMYLIADKAGVTRRTVYNYYDCKEQIAVDLQIISMEKMGWFGLWIEAAENLSEDKLLAMAREMLDEHYQQLKFIVAFDHYFSEGYPDERYIQYLKKHFKIRISTLETGLAAAEEAGRIGPNVEQILFLFQIFISYIQRIVLRTGDLKPDFSRYEHELELMVKMLMYGVEHPAVS